MRGLDQKIFVLRHEHPSKLSGAVEKNRIKGPRCVVCLSGEGVDSFRDKSVRDCRRDMDIHVVSEAH